jgi:hypothetical protein
MWKVPVAFKWPHSWMTESDLFLGLALALAICVPSAQSRAAPLPPRFQDQTVTWDPMIKSRPPIQALRIEVLDRAANSLGQLQWSSPALVRVRSADGARWVQYDLSKAGRQAGFTAIAPEKPAALMESGVKVPHSLARLNWTGRKLELFEGKDQVLWSIDAGFVARNYSFLNGAFSAWASYPQSQLFQLNAPGDTAHRIQWAQDSQIVFFGACTRSRAKNILVENLKNGFTRVVFLGRGLAVLGYTLFDFSSQIPDNLGRSEVSGVALHPVLGRSCEDFVFAGAFGLLRVQYPPQSVQRLE